MNYAQHILSELELAQQHNLLESVSVRPEKTCTVFYVIFTNRVGPENRLKLQQFLREKYRCRTEPFSPDALMIQSDHTLTVEQTKAIV